MVFWIILVLICITIILYRVLYKVAGESFLENTSGRSTHLYKDVSKYFVVMEKWEYDEYEEMILNGTSHLYLTPYRRFEFEKRLAPMEARNKLINETAERNNKGSLMEKAGKIDEAIKVYEENITAGNHARHSYNRLMILYRKQKRYDDELRVALLANDIAGEYEERILKIKTYLQKSRNV